MVFVKFHNMNKKKNSYVAFKLKQSQKFSLYNKSKQCYNHSSKIFSFLFFFFFHLCSDVLSILLKMPVLSFFFSFFHMLCSTISKFLLFLFFSLRLFSIVLYVFVFVFIFFLLFFFIFFFFIINCSFNVPFFFILISTSLSLP